MCPTTGREASSLRSATTTHSGGTPRPFANVTLISDFMARENHIFKNVVGNRSPVVGRTQMPRFSTAAVPHRGIGRYRDVHASEIFKDDDCGVINETEAFPNLRLYQDGESTPVSDLIARESHIFTVVPIASVDAEIDWRVPVFEAGRYLLAFDGAALLLLEVWRRAPMRVLRV